MANYTSTIGLHQWEAKDPVLRTNFNEDFAKIDAAFAALDPRFGGVETARSWLEEAVARMGYEALQGRLAAEVSGKAGPLGRGLIFDCLRDGGRASFSGGCGLLDGGGVQLDTAGLTDFEYFYGNTNYVFLAQSNESLYSDQTFTASGNGTLDTLSVYMRGMESGGYGATVSIREGNTFLWSETRTLTGSIAAYTFRPGLTLKKGTAYTIRIQRTHDRIWIYRGDGGVRFGYKATCTSKGGTSGSITTAPQAMDPFQSVRAWVRHSGGTVSCAVQRGNGGFSALSRVGSRETVDCRGTPCTETEFALTGLARQGGNVSLRVDIRSTADAVVRDLGAAVL